MQRESITSAACQVSQCSSLFENCDFISELNPSILTRNGIQEEYSNKKNKLFSCNNRIESLNLDFTKTMRQSLRPQGVTQESKFSPRSPEKQAYSVQNGKTANNKIQSNKALQENYKYLRQVPSNNINNPQNYKQQSQQNGQYFQKSEVPELTNYISTNVIKTLEPFIDAYIEQRLFIFDQKMIDLTTKIEYLSRNIDLKLDIYQQTIQSQIHQLRLNSHVTYPNNFNNQDSQRSTSFMNYKLGSSDFVLSLSSDEQCSIQRVETESMKSMKNLTDKTQSQLRNLQEFVSESAISDRNQHSLQVTVPQILQDMSINSVVRENFFAYSIPIQKNFDLESSLTQKKVYQKNSATNVTSYKNGSSLQAQFNEIIQKKNSSTNVAMAAQGPDNLTFQNRSLQKNGQSSHQRYQMSNSQAQSSDQFYNSRDVKFLEMSLLSNSSDEEEEELEVDDNEEGVQAINLSLSQVQ